MVVTCRRHGSGCDHPRVPTDPCERLWADVYGELQDVGPAHRHLRRVLRRLLQELDYDSAVDVGCGAGHNFALLRGDRALRRLVGVDVAESALVRARRADPQAELLRLDVQQRPLDGSFDLVFSSLLLEHLSDDESALRHLCKMSIDHVVVATVAGDFERYRKLDEQFGHVRNYRRGELEAKLSAAGARVQRSIYWGYPFYSPLVRTLQNRSRVSSTFGPAARAAAGFLYYLYFLNSSRRGDLLIVHARV